MVIYEGAEEILAFADYFVPCAPRQLDRFHLRLSGSAVHLHAVLNSKL
jgi:hypothetical protein